MLLERHDEEAASKRKLERDLRSVAGEGNGKKNGRHFSVTLISRNFFSIVCLVDAQHA